MNNVICLLRIRLLLPTAAHSFTSGQRRSAVCWWRRASSTLATMWLWCFPQVQSLILTNTKIRHPNKTHICTHKCTDLYTCTHKMSTSSINLGEILSIFYAASSCGHDHHFECIIFLKKMCRDLLKAIFFPSVNHK